MTAWLNSDKSKPFIRVGHCPKGQPIKYSSEDGRKNGRRNNNCSCISIVFIYSGCFGFHVRSSGIDFILERRRDPNAAKGVRNCPMIARRERSNRHLLAGGYRNEEIAEELTIRGKTVKGTQANLMPKRKAPSVSSVIDHALEEGWITVFGVLESRFSKRNAQAN